jgi:hypothetical protein
MEASQKIDLATFSQFLQSIRSRGLKQPVQGLVAGDVC